MAEHLGRSLDGPPLAPPDSGAGLLQRLRDGLVIAGVADELISIEAGRIAAFVAQSNGTLPVLRFLYARITGPLVLEYAKLGAIEFRHCVLDAELVLSHAKLAGHLIFENCDIRDNLRLDWCTIGGSVSLQCCRIEQNAVAHSAKVEGDFLLEGTSFKGEANFERITVTGRVSALPAKATATTFHGRLSWQDAQLLGAVNFAGAQMLADATFERSRIAGPALFRNLVPRGAGEQRTLFGAATCFRGTTFAAGAEFRGVHFQGSVTFENATFNGPALFFPSDAKTRTEFEGPVSFAFARFEHEFNVRSAAFASTAVLARMFVGGPFQCGCWTVPARGEVKEWVGPRVEFRESANFFGTHFAAEANFFGASFDGTADFGCIHADGPARFSRDLANRSVEFRGMIQRGGAEGGRSWAVEFHNANFKAEVTFRSCEFSGRVNFQGMEALDWVSFIAARFHDHVSFREARIRSLILEK